MQFPHPLIETRLVRRYKRFLADVELADGSLETVHCANPGAMAGLDMPGIPAWISDSHNPGRKLRHTLELVDLGSNLVGVNTNLPNRIAEEAILAGNVQPLAGYQELKREVPYGANSRIDLLLRSADRPDAYVEVKNVHFLRTAGVHEFPDCVTARGAKHLRELANMAQSGARAVMLYVIQREDGDVFRLADDIDPHYASAFAHAHSNGVEAYALRCKITTRSIVGDRLIEIMRVQPQRHTGNN